MLLYVNFFFQFSNLFRLAYKVNVQRHNTSIVAKDKNNSRRKLKVATHKTNFPPIIKEASHPRYPSLCQPHLQLHTW